MKILALNCGSSSVKYQLYNWDEKKVIHKGIVDRIGNGKFKTHSDALEYIISLLQKNDKINAIGHRVVHGGSKFRNSCLIDENILNSIRQVKDLGPLHNPANILGIEAAKKALPNVPNIAVFDTAFHQTMPEKSYLYAVPFDWFEKYGVRKYGFHGSSHLYVSKRAAVMLNKKPTDTNLITVHIGNGVSITAIKNGKSIDTSMGLTPLAGAIMGTRSGDIDPAIIIFMMEKEGFSYQDLNNILNNKSGLLGITGKYSDRRDIEQSANEGDVRCRLAIEMEAYRLKKFIGSYMAAIEDKIDAIVFTGGGGEMDSGLRERTLSGLESMGINLDKTKNESAKSRDIESIISRDDSSIKILVIPTNEELVLIEDVVAILGGRYDVHTNFTYSFQEK